MNRPMILFPLLASLVLSGCVTPPPKPDDPYYAPVLPRTPLPAAQNSGAIYQPGFETNLYDDRKAYRVGDIITIGEFTGRVTRIRTRATTIHPGGST